MNQYDFSLSLPFDFDSRMIQLLGELCPQNNLSEAFSHCSYEFEDMGYAYYAGLKGDNWNKHALDFVVEGPQRWISILKENRSVVEKAMSKALKPSESGFLLREVTYLTTENARILPSANEVRLTADIATARSVLADIISIGSRLCTNISFMGNSSENSLNDYLRDMLHSSGYSEVRDQARHGVSASGKDAGEVDLVIAKEGQECAIIEGLKLSSVASSYIDSHIHKVISSYNPLGTPAFVIAYVHSCVYESFWERYSRYLQDRPYNLQIKSEFSEEAQPNAATHVASMLLSRDGYDFPVFFITLKLCK